MAKHTNEQPTTNEKSLITTRDVIILALTALAGIAAYCGLFKSMPALSYITIVLIDTYFLHVIFYAAIRSDIIKNENWGLLIPNKFMGVIIFLGLYCFIIWGFAEILLHENAPDYTSIRCAIYKSVVSISSLSFDDYGDQPWSLQKLQMWQSLNGILLLTATFGFLISRISTFQEKITLKTVYDSIQNLKPEKDIADPLAAIETIVQNNKDLTAEKNKLKLQIEDLQNRPAANVQQQVPKKNEDING